MPEPISPSPSDWQNVYQGIVILLTAIAAGVAAVFGKKAASNGPNEEEQIRHELAEALAKANAAERALAETQMRNDWAAALGALKTSLLGEVDRVKQDARELEDRVQEIEAKLRYQNQK